MMAVKWSIPNIPRFEIVKVPPYGHNVKIHSSYATSSLLTWYSAGESLPSLAFFASAFVSAEMVASPLAPASLIIGVIRPEGVATATEMSDFLYLLKQIVQ